MLTARPVRVQLEFLPREPSTFEVLKIGGVVAAACPELEQASWARTRLTKVNGTEVATLKQAIELATGADAGETVDLEFEQLVEVCVISFGLLTCTERDCVTAVHLLAAPHRPRNVAKATR